MQLKGYKWIVLLAVLEHITTSIGGARLQMDNDYFYQDAETEDALSPNNEMQPDAKKYFYSGVPNSMNSLVDPSISAPTAGAAPPSSPPDNGCAPETPPASAAPPTEPPASTTAAPETTTTAATAPSGDIPAPSSSSGNGDSDAKTKELRILVQHLYIAQARVQLEATEIKKAQAVANAAQQQLEEAANHVRSVTAALQNAQQEVAAAAIRAQTAQLQLAAHDQLLFAARQDVDALSSQMVGLQAAEGISQPKITFDLMALLEKLKQPLPDDQKPTAVPPVIAAPTFSSAPSGAKAAGKTPRHSVRDEFYE